MEAEQRVRWTNRIYLDIIKRMVAAIEERYGAESRKVAADALYGAGRELAQQLRELLHNSGEEPLDYAEIQRYMDTNLYGIEEEVLPGEEGEVTIRVTYCTAPGIFSPRDCKLFLPFVQGMMDEINPQLNWKATKVLTRGDDCCEFIISKHG